MIKFRTELLLLLFCAASCGCEQGSEHHQSETATARAASVTKESFVSIEPTSKIYGEIKTAPISMRTLNLTIEATGQLQANANAVTRVSAPVAGKIAAVHASVGEMVRSGETLASITSQEVGGLTTELFKSEIDIDAEVSKDLLEIDFQRKQAEAELALCEKQLERAKLLQQEKITSAAAVEALQTEADKHRLALAALEEKKRRTKEISETKKSLNRTTLAQRLSLLGMDRSTIENVMNNHNVVNTIPIKTPQAGFVLERNVNPGELVDSSKTLFVVDDIDNLWLVAEIFEQDIERVAKGQRVEFTVDSFPKEHFSGQLDFVAGTINLETRTLSVRAVIANPRLKLKPKMFARMKIYTESPRVLAIPKAAVQDAGSRKVAYVKVSEGKFEERPVVLGNDAGDYIHVIAGVREGERVVTEGSFSLRSQMLKQVR